MKKNEYGIAEWKRDSWIERFLGDRADGSSFWKRCYVEYYKIINRAYFDRGVVMAEKAIDAFLPIEDAGKKASLITDMVYSLHRFGTSFDEYFLFDYRRLNAAGRASFVTDKGRWGLYARLNGGTNLPLFMDKYETYKAYRSFYCRQLIPVQQESDRCEAIELMMKGRDLFFKPRSDSVGRGIRKITAPTSPDEANRLFNEIMNQGGASLSNPSCRLLKWRGCTGSP